MVGVTLLTAAREAGLTIEADGARLVVRGPRMAEPLVQQLLANKADVLAALATEGQWSEWIEQHGGRAWHVIQRDGVEAFPWLGGGPPAMPGFNAPPKREPIATGSAPGSLEAERLDLSSACGRCGCREFVDVWVHDGESVRRDCAGCGRFIAFTTWPRAAAP